MSIVISNTSHIDRLRSPHEALAPLSAAWRRLREGRQARRDLVALSRRDPRLLRDMGLDPERVYEALDGTADAVGPAHLSPLLRLTERL